MNFLLCRKQGQSSVNEYKELTKICDRRGKEKFLFYETQGPQTDPFLRTQYRMQSKLHVLKSDKVLQDLRYFWRCS